MCTTCFISRDAFLQDHTVPLSPYRCRSYRLTCIASAAGIDGGSGNRRATFNSARSRTGRFLVPSGRPLARWTGTVVSTPNVKNSRIKTNEDFIIIQSLKLINSQIWSDHRKNLVIESDHRSRAYESVEDGGYLGLYLKKLT